MEQVIFAKQERFGRKSEKMEDASQICFHKIDCSTVFLNEAEVVCDLETVEPKELEVPASKGEKKCRSFQTSSQTHRPLFVRNGIGD